MRTAINLWTLRNVEEPLPRILEHVADAGFDGVQFSGGLRDTSVSALGETLETTGLDVTTPHVGFDQIEDDFEATVDTYTSLGCTSLTIPYLDPACLDDAAAVQSTIDRLTQLQARLANCDLELHYHNHDAEFEAVAGQLVFDRLLDETTLQLELDVGWVSEAGSDPIERLRQVEDRCTFVHMRDVTADGGDAELGDGVVDLGACAETAHDIGAEWLIYERIDPPNFIASLEHAAGFLGELATEADE